MLSRKEPLKENRLKSIDIFRGLSVLWMILTHLQSWWLQSEDLWLAEVNWAILFSMSASAFLFIGGVSTTLSYRNRCVRTKISNVYNYRTVRNTCIFRALFLLIIALLYNSSIAL